VNRSVTSRALAALCSLALLPWLPVPARAQLTADAHENPPHVELDQVLPETSMQSGEHRVEDTLGLKGTLFQFRLDSDQGRYEALSIPMVLLRIHEIRTLAQSVDAFQRENQRLAEQLRGVVYTGNNASVPILGSSLDGGSYEYNQYINNNVGQAVEDLERKSKRQSPISGSTDGGNMYESWVPSDPILASHKRAVAMQLDLDIYSSNTRVQAFLDTLARARGGGNRNAGMATVALPNKPEIKVDKGRVEFAVRSSVARKTVRELYIQNEAALKAMGIDPELYHAFLSHRAFSPRHKTEITAYLVYMNGVSNRGALLRSALGAKDEVSALGYTRMARMLAYYHENTERLTGLVSGGTVLMATTGSGNMVMVLPFDLVWWSAESDRVFSSLAEFADQNAFKLRELLMVGIGSNTARGQLERRGFVVRERFLFSR
jgi:hypothetical protein